MISNRAKAILSEGASEDGERTILFIDEGSESLVLRLFRAGEGDEDEDPKRQAVRWLGRVMSLCRSAHGDLRTKVIPSNGGEYVMAAVSGNDIEARE